MLNGWQENRQKSNKTVKREDQFCHYYFFLVFHEFEMFCAEMTFLNSYPILKWT